MKKGLLVLTIILLPASQVPDVSSCCCLYPLDVVHVAGFPRLLLLLLLRPVHVQPGMCLVRGRALQLVKVVKHQDRVAEVMRRHRRKVWTQKKILSFNIRYFVAILRFVVIYTLFGRLQARKVLFWVINSVSWARSALLHGTYRMLY